MIEMRYDFNYNLNYRQSSAITNDMVTGKYKIINDDIYVEMRENNSFLQRIIFLKKYWYHYVYEGNIYFVDVEYFNCKDNDA